MEVKYLVWNIQTHWLHAATHYMSCSIFSLTCQKQKQSSNTLMLLKIQAKAKWKERNEAKSNNYLCVCVCVFLGGGTLRKGMRQPISFFFVDAIIHGSCEFHPRINSMCAHRPFWVKCILYVLYTSVWWPNGAICEFHKFTTKAVKWAIECRVYTHTYNNSPNNDRTTTTTKKPTQSIVEFELILAIGLVVAFVFLLLLLVFSLIHRIL